MAKLTARRFLAVMPALKPCVAQLKLLKHQDHCPKIHPCVQQQLRAARKLGVPLDWNKL